MWHMFAVVPACVARWQQGSVRSDISVVTIAKAMH